MQTNGINTQQTSTTGDLMTLSIDEILSPSPPPISQTMTSSSEGSLVKLLASLENAPDSTTYEGRCFLKSLGFLETNDPGILYSKTSRVYLVMTVEKLSSRYLRFSPTWGMSINGVFLTRKISVSPNAANGSTLQDILEEHPDPRYFLDESQQNKLMPNMADYPPVDHFVQLTETRTDEAKKIRRESMRNGRDFSPRRGKKLVPRTDNLANTITATQGREQLLTNFRQIRYLTPLECERLQAFPDGWTGGAPESQRLKQMGNALTTMIPQYIAAAIIKSRIDENNQTR